MRHLLLLVILVCAYAGFSDAFDGDFESQLRKEGKVSFIPQNPETMRDSNTLFWSEIGQSLTPKVLHLESTTSRVNRTLKADKSFALGDLGENINFQWEQPKNEAKITISKSQIFSNVSFENPECLVLKIQGHKSVDRIKITLKKGFPLILDGIINPESCLLFSSREKGPQQLGFYIQNALEVTFYRHATWSETLALPVTVAVGAAISLSALLKIYGTI